MLVSQEELTQILNNTFTENNKTKNIIDIEITNSNTGEEVKYNYTFSIVSYTN